MEEYKEAKEWIDNIIAHPQWGTTYIDWDAIDQLKELLDKADETLYFIRNF